MKLLAFLLACSAIAGAEDILPQALPRDRYAETVGKSPFVLETKAEAPTVEKVNPFQNLYLRGLDKTGGIDHVSIQRLGEERPMRTFVGNEPGDDELSVQSVRIGDTFKETRVVLKKGSETGEVKFKEEAPAPALVVDRSVRGPTVPSQFPRPGGMAPPPMPQSRPVQPGVLPQPIPRPQGSIPQPSNIPQPPGGVKVRPRVINQ